MLGGERAVEAALLPPQGSLEPELVIWPYLETQSREERRHAQTSSLGLSLAPGKLSVLSLNGPDPWVCPGGLSQAARVIWIWLVGCVHGHVRTYPPPRMGKQRVDGGNAPCMHILGTEEEDTMWAFAESLDYVRIEPLN